MNDEADYESCEWTVSPFWRVRGKTKRPPTTFTGEDEEEDEKILWKTN